MTTTKYNLMAGGATDNWKSVSVALTNAATTTAEIAMGPYVIGGVSNESGADLTLTLSAASSQGGTSLVLNDEDSVAVATVLIDDDEYNMLPGSIAAVPYLIVTSNAAAATGVTLHFKKQG